MSLFKKSKNEKPKITAPIAGGDLDLLKQVHVMPKRYYLTPKKNNFATFLIIVIGFLIVAILAAAAYYLNENLKQAQSSKVKAAPSQEINENIDVDTNQPAAATTTEPIPEEIITPTSTEITTPTSTSPAEVPAESETPVVEPNSEANNSAPPALALDADNDLLTAQEEKLFGTSANKADTDSDGYLDGGEILSGYNPLKPGKKLANSGLFEDYKNSYFSVMYPKSWRLKISDQQGTEVLFISGLGEFVEVLVIDNPQALSLNDWLKQQFGSAMPAMTSLTVNNLTGLRESNDLKYYFVKNNDNSRVYLLTYNIGNATEANFMTTFSAMVKSFQAL
ncbi:MAG: hypothetical protein WCX71_05825 [Candidatus Buchananbacteria bacterium]